MSRAWLIFTTKLLDLLAMRGWLLVLFLLPLLLGSIAGTANLANRAPVVELAIIDEDQTAASQTLIRRLAENDSLRIESSDASRQRLDRQQIDGLLTIREGYSDHLAVLNEADLWLEPASQSLTVSIIEEAVAAAVLPSYAHAVIMDRLTSRYQQLDRSPPDNLAAALQASMEAYAAGDARLNITYVGNVQPVPVLTHVVTDDSMEVFFLSIYAVLGGLVLAGDDLRRRLSVTHSGLLADYLATQGALLLIGSVQILLYSVVMARMMDLPVRPEQIGILMVFLILMLGISQLFQLIARRVRLFISLLILLVLAIAGGCFFQLPEKLLRLIGQYSPHGWALSRIRGFPTLPIGVPLLFTLLCLICGYLWQKHLAARPAAG